MSLSDEAAALRASRARNTTRVNTSAIESLLREFAQEMTRRGTPTVPVHEQRTRRKVLHDGRGASVSVWAGGVLGHGWPLYELSYPGGVAHKQEFVLLTDGRLTAVNHVFHRRFLMMLVGSAVRTTTRAAVGNLDRVNLQNLRAGMADLLAKL